MTTQIFNIGLIVRATTIILLLGFFAIAGCSRKMLGVVFDVPESTDTPDTTGFENRRQFLSAVAVADTVRPPIEQFLEPDTVRSLLPRDHAGNIDWVSAIRQGIIKPRAQIPGDTLSLRKSDDRLGFDFYLKGPAAMFDAYFPHSAHTEWVSCQQCHPRIFRYRGAEIKMADVLQGEYCGECHGKVAFPPITGCERCHTELPQKANRAQPDLLGTFRLIRSTQGAITSSTGGDSTTSDTRAMSTADLPNSVFPHWIHRIQYKCKACHTDVFEPKLGANDITMKDISEGRACGRCHNGVTAFAAGFGECQRCHTAVGSAEE